MTQQVFYFVKFVNSKFLVFNIIINFKLNSAIKFSVL